MRTTILCKTNKYLFKIFCNTLIVHDKTTEKQTIENSMASIFRGKKMQISFYDTFRKELLCVLVQYVPANTVTS